MTVHSLAWETLRRERGNPRVPSICPVDRLPPVYMDDWKVEHGPLPGHYVRHLPTGCLLRVTDAFTYLVDGPDFEGVSEVAVEAIAYVRIVEA